MAVLVLVGSVALFAQVLGAPIVSPPTQAQAQPQQQASGGGNVSVSVQAPQPDPKATQAMYDYTIASSEYDHGSAPVTWATSLLSGANIWTRTPAEHFNNASIKDARNKAKGAAMGLFLLAILWTGFQLALGAGLGHTSYQQLLPVLIGGFLICAYADTITSRMVDLCNWLNEVMGAPSLPDFSKAPLTMPEKPVFDVAVPIASGFVSGVIGSVIYAVILLLLEVKMIFREAVLWVGTAAMPIAGILWAVEITKSWGGKLLLLFFGWLFGQPLVVLCLALASSMLTMLNMTDPAAEWLVKVAVLLVALKAVTIFAGGGLGSGPGFGIAGLFLLMRRFGRGFGGASPPSTPAAAAPTPSPAVQPGGAGGGTGGGSAATGRPWRPALGTA